MGDNAQKQVTADVLETDRSNDLALLRISSTKMASADTKSLISKLGITVVPLASDGLLRSEDVELGEDVLVAGYPYGDIFSNTIKVQEVWSVPIVVLEMIPVSSRWMLLSNLAIVVDRFTMKMETSSEWWLPN